MREVVMKKIAYLSLAIIAAATLFAGCDNQLKSEVDALTERVNGLEEENEQLRDKIEELELKLKQGEFYTLREAFEQNLLSQDDLLSIAYYYNGGRESNEELMGENFAPAPKIPEFPDNLTEKAIRQTFWNKYFESENPDGITLDDVGIENSYYGTYGDCVAVMVWRAGAYQTVWEDVEVGGVHFIYPNNNRILIWVEK